MNPVVHPWQVKYAVALVGDKQTFPVASFEIRILDPVNMHSHIGHKSSDWIFSKPLQSFEVFNPNSAPFHLNLRLLQAFIQVRRIVLLTKGLFTILLVRMSLRFDIP
jgi:hypothetical protein